MHLGIDNQHVDMLGLCKGVEMLQTSPNLLGTLWGGWPHYSMVAPDPRKRNIGGRSIAYKVKQVLPDKTSHMQYCLRY